MGLSLLDPSTTLQTLQCGRCGVWHAIPQSMYDTSVEEGGFWHCPNGHSRGFSEGSIKKQLEKEKRRREWAEADAKRQREQAEENERRRAAQKGATTRLRNRAKAGVCPCCNRTFKQLAAHMANKHPGFGGDDA